MDRHISLNLIGCCIACGLSYALHKSFWWAFVHFCLGCVYLSYQFSLMYLIN